VGAPAPLSVWLKRPLHRKSFVWKTGTSAFPEPTRGNLSLYRCVRQPVNRGSRPSSTERSGSRSWGPEASCCHLWGATSVAPDALMFRPEPLCGTFRTPHCTGIPETLVGRKGSVSCRSFPHLLKKLWKVAFFEADRAFEGRFVDVFCRAKGREVCARADFGGARPGLTGLVRGVPEAKVWDRHDRK
jgi:hypothetical protein